MKVTRNEIENVLALLERPPQRITSALMNTQKDVYFKPNQKEWSAHETLMHLRVCADVWGDTIHAMLTQDKPVIAEIHPNVQLKNGNYREQEFVTSFRVFADQREKLLQTLKNIHFEDWSRSAMIGGRQHTVFSQARRMALHEDEHCAQIEELLG